MKKLLLFGALAFGFFVLTSCGSIRSLQPDNTVRIQTNITDNETVVIKNQMGESYKYAFENSSIIIRDYQYELFTNDFTKKKLNLSISHEDYETRNISLKRALRPGIFTLDLLGALALYLSPSMIIDFANGNVWKINKNSKYKNLKFNFNDAYYKSRYELAQSYGLADSISNYILIYGNSPYRKDAMDYRDFLIKRDGEYDVLKSSKNYWRAEKFISNYPNSIYQDELNKLTPQYYFNYKSNKSLPWDSIGNSMQVLYSNSLISAEEFEKQNKHVAAVENYEYALKIFFDPEINVKKDEANNLFRIDLVKNGDDFIENQNYESAINVYKKAQSISYSQEVQSKLNNANSIYRKILAERERQRKIERENSAIKCAVCKIKYIKMTKDIM